MDDTITRIVSAIDGKALRHSFDGDRQSALHNITVWHRTRGPVLAQMKSAGKKNEQSSVKVHWVLDVTFGEDDSRIRRGDDAENVAVIRRFCLNLARLHPQKYW